MKPNLPVLGPKLGKELGAVRAALQAGEFEELPDGGVRVAGHELTRDEVLVEREGKDGWAIAASDGLTVALDLHLDDDLVRAGRVYDLIHCGELAAQGAGSRADGSDPRSRSPRRTRTCLEHREWIAQSGDARRRVDREGERALGRRLSERPRRAALVRR